MVVAALEIVVAALEIVVAVAEMVVAVAEMVAEMAMVAAIEMGWWWRRGDNSGSGGEGSDCIKSFSGFPDRVASFNFAQLAIK